jgi:ubiquinone/menaquinone biosynthesis C-methylase UbiE
MQSLEAERLFSGQIGAEYELLKLICPGAAEMSRQVGETVANWQQGQALHVFEIGCGTGITTLSLLAARENISIHAVDNEPTMLVQAQINLAPWLQQGRLRLTEADALSALQVLPEASVDVVASGYAIHNFLQGYRQQVLAEIFRVLKPGGLFVNGDRYALDDTLAHTGLTQKEVRHWFKTFAELGRYDLLEHWVVHLFSDESADHIMRLGLSITDLERLGLMVEVAFRVGVNTLLRAVKP